MLTTLIIVAPIFALVFVGYGCRRIGVLSANATTELNRFVVYLALPALLFDIMAHATWATIYQPGFIAVFGLSGMAVFVVTAGVRWRASRSLADASIDGLNAGYGNTAFIGFPLCLALFGQAALTPTTIASILTVCLMFALAVMLVEIGLQAEAHPSRLALNVGRALVKNPLVMAPVLGAIVAASGLAIPASVETFLKLLGAAASPCALVALGLFLAREAPGAERNSAPSLVFVIIKLLIMPAIAWGLAKAFGLPPLLTNITVVLAALPTGTGPFMVAEFYGREAGVTSKTILISTVASLLTISAYMAWVAWR